MAEAPGHRLGQIIGEALEIALEPVLRKFAEDHDLYLDKQGDRAARRGRKVTWADVNGNAHDLDFVLERGGTESKVGVPVAFIESAWRRYTKHSRNKAQEIQGAVEPLIRKYAAVKPLGGAIVGGQWTLGALNQLRSLGFAVAYIEYEEVVKAFASVGVDVATNEATTDADLAKAVAAYDRLTDAERGRLGEAIRACAPAEFARFVETLERAIVRAVQRVVIVALHGSPQDCPSVASAIATLRDYSLPASSPAFCKWEVSIRFTNDDRIEATFARTQDAIDFLESFA